MTTIRGIGVSPGVAVGAALVAIQRTQVIRFPVTAGHVGRELAALEQARARSREQLEQIRSRIAGAAGGDLAAIFDAQLLMLDDPLLVERAGVIVREEHVNAEWAVQRAFDEVADLLNGIRDPYLRERKGDLHDVAGRLRMNLRGEHGGVRDLLQDLDGPCVLVADELTPSVVAQLDWTKIRGFATDAGSRTYHTAILARSLGVPAVVALRDASVQVPVGATILVDGDAGTVVIDPGEPERADAERRNTRRGRPGAPMPREAQDAQTADGIAVRLLANIERVDDVHAALEAGADGIGLYRSESLLGGGPPDLVGEDEQYDVYRHVVRTMAGRPVTIRTFDIDERQLVRPPADLGLDARWTWDDPRVGHGGLRGIRFGLAQPAIFKTQVRALLRAAADGDLRIMFPFVSSVQEVRAARALLREAADEVVGRGLPVGAVRVGIMIEVPSAAVTASLLAREVDFFTIGTNDLIQYTLAVDRIDPRVSDRYEPLHPAVLRLIRQAQRGAARRGIPASLCGEMASDPVLLRVLVGCGLREFSMTPGAIGTARRVIRQTNGAEMARLAARVMSLGTVEEIEALLASELDSGAPRPAPTR